MNNNDIKIIRSLAKRVKIAAEDPQQEVKRELWKQHNSLQSKIPLIYISPEGSWQELVTEKDLHCENPELRRIEETLRQKLYYNDVLADDQPIESHWVVPKTIESTGWGIEEKEIHSSNNRGAWHFDPVLFEYNDINKIKSPIITYNAEATEKERLFMEDLFDGILNVEVKGVQRLEYHLMKQYSKWRGLEETLMDMYLNPEMLHEAMAMLYEGHAGILKQYIEQDLLDANSDDTYHASGGNGYLPNGLNGSLEAPTIQPIHLWASSESQELSEVSPEHHAEFALTYEKKLLKPFGLIGYGCCEGLHDKLDDVFEIDNLRRISISPWADVNKSAEKLKGDYIFSWKPQPAQLVGNFNPDEIRSYLRKTIDTALSNDCVLEIILKDTHTVENHPERFNQWLNIAREEIRSAREEFAI